MVFRGNPILVGNQILFNTSSYGSGVEVFRSSMITFTNNVIWGNAAQGVWASGANNYPVLGVLVNNTIAESEEDGIFLLDYVTFSLTNNIVVSNTVGISVMNATTVTMDHTLFFGNGEMDVGGVGVITNTQAITGSVPGFINATEGDYHLRLGSAAIDTGAAALWLADDIDGDPRPWPEMGVYDVGADEFVPFLIHLPYIER